MSILGSWKKITDADCSAKYPAGILFNKDGTFKAKGSSRSGLYPVWDVGSYSQSGAIVSMSTSNDAVIRYTTLLRKDILTFEDPEGCRFSYVRVEEGVKFP